jgi:type I restriction enzyme M protein
MNAETKRHIDAARQVLVGVVPNPTSQIDQITNALIYKFMDDMDQSAIKSGGDASFFTGDLERYAWTRLMDTRVGNQERMNLYSEALVKFSESKQLPELFRNIFKSAYLPYRSPDVLGLFLKEIDYFNYSHPEELGNAYEYLLSIMSSQGDAGQFRTPRHIIDFIVEAVNPTKDDKVLDPACGTGGFLISAYKNILKQHDGKDDPKKKEKPLTPDQRRTLMQNFEGYDIDPGMVRIAQVNMYLHQFKNPKIVQYDSLSMDERWNDKFDVILANPPFMSPKGGVSTHNKFGIQSTRSEVLFVDYIMNHLRPKGRAGIIVPEGIIFQSATAYKQLRKNLVNNGLYAVVSLPSGVFQPYSGVKTSILFFDNEIAKKDDDVLFIKINNDGFDLGAQRRPLKTSHLPAALEILHLYREHVLGGKKIVFKSDDEFALLVSKEKITKSDDYSLSGDRYRTNTDYENIKWPLIEIGELCELGRGRVISKRDIENDPGPYPVYSSQTTDNGIFGYINTFDFDGEYVTWTTDGANAGTVFHRNGKFNCTNVCGTLKAKTKDVDMRFLAKVLNNVAYKYVIQVGNPKLMNNVMAKIKIPVPPLEVQKEIVEQIEIKQRAIEGAREVIKNLERERDGILPILLGG